MAGTKKRWKWFTISTNHTQDGAEGVLSATRDGVGMFEPYRGLQSRIKPGRERGERVWRVQVRTLTNQELTREGHPAYLFRKKRNPGPGIGPDQNLVRFAGSDGFFVARNPGGARVVHNKLLGGWYIVTGPHQTPIGGRFGSKGEAEAHLAEHGGRGGRPKPSGARTVRINRTTSGVSVEPGSRGMYFPVSSGTEGRLVSQTGRKVVVKIKGFPRLEFSKGAVTERNPASPPPGVTPPQQDVPQRPQAHAFDNLLGHSVPLADETPEATGASITSFTNPSKRNPYTRRKRRNPAPNLTCPGCHAPIGGNPSPGVYTCSGCGAEVEVS